MNTVTYSHVRNNLGKTMDQVCSDHTPVIVNRKNQQPVVILSLKDYESLVETAYLSRSPKNAERLMRAITRLKSYNLLASIPPDFTYPDDVQDFVKSDPVSQEIL